MQLPGSALLSAWLSALIRLNGHSVSCALTRQAVAQLFGGQLQQQAPLMEATNNCSHKHLCQTRNTTPFNRE